LSSLSFVLILKSPVNLYITMSCGTWKLVPLLASKSIIGCKWFYTLNRSQW